MPATHLLTADGRKVKMADALAHPAWFGDMDEEVLSWLLGGASRTPYCDISVTELIDPPQVTTLELRHEYAERPDDIVDRALGRWFHGAMEQKAPGRGQRDVLVEQPMVMKIGKTLVGGTPDKLYYDPKRKCDVLISRKVRKVKWWRWYKRGVATLQEERMQESCYAYLARHAKFLSSGKAIKRNPTKAYLQFFLRDWDKMAAEDAKEHVDEYPPPFGMIELPLLDDDAARQYIEARLDLHLAARSLPDEQLPACDDRDRWTNRYGEPLRCKYFCGVSSVCRQWRREANTGF